MSSKLVIMYSRLLVDLTCNSLLGMPRSRDPGRREWRVKWPLWNLTALHHCKKHACCPVNTDWPIFWCRSAAWHLICVAIQSLEIIVRSSSQGIATQWCVSITQCQSGWNYQSAVVVLASQFQVEKSDACRTLLEQRMTEGFIHRCPVLNDVQEFNASTIDADLICGGFPCQARFFCGVVSWLLCSNMWYHVIFYLEVSCAWFSWEFAFFERIAWHTGSEHSRSDAGIRRW